MKRAARLFGRSTPLVAILAGAVVAGAAIGDIALAVGLLGVPLVRLLGIPGEAR